MFKFEERRLSWSTDRLLVEVNRGVLINTIDHRLTTDGAFELDVLVHRTPDSLEKNMPKKLSDIHRGLQDLMMLSNLSSHYKGSCTTQKVLWIENGP